MSVQSVRYRRTLAAIAAASVAIPVGLAAAPAFAAPTAISIVTANQPSWALDMETEVFNRINDYRQSQGVAPLTRNSAVDAVARTWSESQAANSDMSHNPDYGQLMPAGASSWSENVAYLDGYSPDEMARVFVDGWIGSEGHRQNLLDADATHTGVGVAQNAGGEVYATQNFGSYSGALEGDGQAAPVEEPAAPVEEPAVAPAPEVEQEPAPAPAEVEQPEPGPVEEPAAPAEEPAPVEEPAAPAEEPAPADEPTPAEEPAPADEPTPADESATPAEDDEKGASDDHKERSERDMSRFERAILEFLLRIFGR